MDNSDTQSTVTYNNPFEPFTASYPQSNITSEFTAMLVEVNDEEIDVLVRSMEAKPNELAKRRIIVNFLKSKNITITI